MSTTPLAQPYPGLRPFLQSEAELFFGRAEDINRMLACLEERRFLAVVGGSGSGKSSLVRAGLLPVLGQGYLLGAGTDWRFVVMRPGGDPFGNLAAEFHRAIGGGETPDAGDVAFTHAALLTSPRGFLEVLEEAGLDKGTPLLLLVDQFEEIFRFRRRRAGGEDARTIREERNGATAFVNVLLTTAQAAAKAELPLYVMLTMRSDFMGDCDVFPGLPQAISDSQFLVPRLTRGQMQEIIEKPLLLFGWKAAPELVNHILNDAGTDPDLLPLMQHALMRTWHAAQARLAGGDAEKVLLLSDYVKVGGFSDALSQHLEEAWRSLTGEREERIAQQLFICLSQQSGAGTLVRRMAKLGEVASVANAEAGEVAKVVRLFQEGERNFVMASPPGGLNAESVLDISHEALLRQWARLRSWLAEEAKSADTYLRLADGASRWKAGEADLLQGRELRRALEWKQSRNPTATWAERYHPGFADAIRYLEESRQAEDKKTRRALAIRRNIRVAVAVACALLAATAIWAMFNARAANKNLVAAKVAQSKAQIARSEADTLALHAKLRENAALVDDFLPRRPVNALVLAIQVAGEHRDNHLEDLPQVQEGLVRALQGAKWSKLFDTADGFGGRPDVVLLDVLTSVDLQTIVSLHSLLLDDKTVVRIWDAEGNPVATLPEQAAIEGAYPVALSPDGLTILTGGDDGKVQMWDRAGKRIKTLPMPPTGPVRTITISADGQVIVIGKDGLVEFRTFAGEAVGAPIKIGRKFDVVKLSPDRQWILSYLRTDAKSGPRLQDRNGELRKDFGASVMVADFSPDGRQIVTGSNDGTVQLWNYAGEAIGAAINAHHGQVFAVAFSPDGQRILSGGTDGAVQLWNLDGTAVCSPRWQSDAVFSVACSPDGRKIVSGMMDGYVRVWPLDEELGDALENPHGEKKADWSLASIAISADGGTTVGGGEDGAVSWWNRDGKIAGSSAMKHPARVTCVATSADGNAIVAIGGDGSVQLWNRQGTPIPGPSLPENAGVTCVAVRPDGKAIVLGDKAGKVWAWDIGKPAPECLAGGVSEVTSVAIGSDGTIVYGCRDGSITASLNGRGKPVLLLEANHDPARRFSKLAITSLVINRGGQKIVAGGEDARMWVWTIERNDALVVPRPISLTGNVNPVTSLAIVDDGKYIVNSSAGDHVYLWDLTGMVAASPLGSGYSLRNDVTATAFSGDPDAPGILMASRNERRVWFWRIGRRGTWLQEACERVRSHRVLVDPEDVIAHEMADERTQRIVEEAAETCFNHGGWSNAAKAAFRLRQGYALANVADISRAVARFREALELDPHIVLDARAGPGQQDPEGVAQRLAARAKAWVEYQRARK
jgi:WD40 repeat protein